MWYILIMNKDVIYIEAEDDITDIISKIESSKEKIVALVPPKKSGVLRSIVNIKLISKAGQAAEKNIVLVTTDASIVKLAAMVRLPVTKNLQTAPSIPTLDDADSEPAVATKEEITEEPTEDDEETSILKVADAIKTEKEASAPSDEVKEEKTEKSEEKEEEEDEDDKKAVAAKPEKKAKAPQSKFMEWFTAYKKWILIGSGAGALLILFLVWAFVIAPSVKISVSVRTNSNNFSENITFTTDQTKESSEDGVFYLETIQEETEKTLEFQATGSKNVGEKATGSVVVYSFFRGDGGAIAINAGTSFTYGDLTYYADEDAYLSWDGNDGSCNNHGTIGRFGCLVYLRIAATAAEPGERYNISAEENWRTSNNSVRVESGEFGGGSDKTVTVITEQDVESVKERVESTAKAAETTTLDALKEKAGEGKLIITSSFKQSFSEPVVTPAVGEAVEDGVTPVLKITSTATLYAIDEVKVKEFITNKARISDTQKIYTINNPFVENFIATDTGFTGKLKTSYKFGPKITDEDILELVKGKGIGDIQHTLKSIDGVGTIEIEKSMPWVNAAPSDSNKITIELTVEGDK